MRAATKMLLLAGAALAIAGCKKEQAQQNEVAANEASPNADIEALPADESSATPSNELVNGDDSADANTATNNAY